MTCDGAQRLMALAKAKAATMDTADAANMIQGRADGRKAERKRASRMALPATS